MSYQLDAIRHETRNFWVLDVGRRGYEVHQKGITHSTRVASIGLGETLGLPKAIDECERRQAIADATHDKAANQHKEIA